MSKPIEPVTAWAAVSPGGLIVARTVSLDVSDTAEKTGLTNARLDAEGWTIRQVEIRVKEEG